MVSFASADFGRRCGPHRGGRGILLQGPGVNTIADQDIAVLVASCDRYSDVWQLFFKLFRKQWPDCPHAVYLGSNTVGCAEPGVANLLVGPDDGWGKGVKAMLERLTEPYVLLFLDDYFLLKPVERARLEAVKTASAQAGAAFVLLSSPLRADRPLPGHPGIGKLDPGAPYRASLNVALWRRDILLSLLKPEENPWQFEIIASRRSDVLPTPFLVSRKPVFHIDKDGVARGLWTRASLRMAARQGVAIDLTRRGVLARNRERARYYNLPKKWILKVLPWRVRFKIGDALRAMGWKKPLENRVGF